MLTLRKDQLEAITATAGGSFRERVLRHVTKVFPDQVNALGPDPVAERIDRGLERAETFGMTTERNLTLCVDLYFGLGPDFEEQDDCRGIVEILQSEKIAEGAKMVLVYEEIPRVEEARAAREESEA